ncbi:sodium:glutamate symporter [Chromobacterium sp. LK11]|uniref:sodium/glutamate symporter n=1 Tax=Chromobacterium sp. LK11 TaxID=1628212 RepID=UPI0006530D79|nr:sodium/glutamate symporter [Chromobacterium sp. LK11]KMN82723.1 sodium:glutamate symporter [Chromobacterium sp. LK11]
MQQWKLDLIATTALAVLALLAGYRLKRHVRFFERFCIPAPVIGGFAVSIVVLLLRESGVAAVSFDTTLQTPFMVAFFTTVGIGGSLALLRTGGSTLLIYLGICWALAVFQNVFGAGAAALFGLDPTLGVMAGGVSLEGGHGAAAAFGPMAEQLGTRGATAVALASATFGLIAGGVLGGPLASWLIRRYQLPIQPSSGGAPTPAYHDHEASVTVNSDSLIAAMGLVLALMTAGTLLARQVEQRWDFVLPAYVGAMFAAIVFRNLNDRARLLRLNSAAIDAIADISLGVFLTMAMMSLKIWELYDLALPLLGVLSLQVVALTAISVFIAFRLLGKNYDAAVMCAGLMGHGLGATPNAVANMSAVCQKHGATSYKAFLIIPLCGAVLIDLVAIPFHAWIINYLH